MLVLYFDYRQLGHHLRVCFIFLAVPFGLLFRETAHHLENILALIKVSFIILHELGGRRSVHSLLHTQELVATE